MYNEEGLVGYPLVLCILRELAGAFFERWAKYAGLWGSGD
jgi:hypothetical protein